MLQQPALLDDQALSEAADSFRSLARAKPEPRDDREFHDIVSLAARLLDAPIAWVATSRGGHERLQAQYGLEPGAPPPGQAIARALSPANPVQVVADTAAHPHLCDDPGSEATAQPRFHVAVGLFDRLGRRLGTLAVADVLPRPSVEAAAVEMLRGLGRLAAGLIERRQLRRAARIASQIAQADFSAVVVFDNEERVAFANRSAEAMFDPALIARGVPVDELFPARLQDDPEDVAAWLRGGHGHGSAQEPRHLRVGDASGRVLTLEAARCAWCVGGDSGMALILRDVTDQLRHHASLQQLALYDPLTGLPNRNGLTSALTEALERTTQPLALAVIGLDNFKTVNDTLGHIAGDAVLRVTAGRLQASLPEGAAVARIGGDEFALIFPGLSGADVTGHVGDMLQAIGRPYYVDGNIVHMDASAGIAMRDQAGSAGDMIAHADLALYKAKADGGRKCRWFSPEMRVEAHDRRQLDLELRRAFAEGQFELHYQPQVDLLSGRTIGAEALLRWRHPSRGLLAPAHFLDALQRSAINGPLGRWVLHQACQDAARWPRACGVPLLVSINLFPSQFSDGNLVEEIEAALAASGLAPERVELELTENIALRHDDATALALTRLRERGIRLAFDDFGTGYASLSMLQRLPIDRVKIDRSFVHDMLDNRNDAAIVGSIVLISRNLDLRVIAEGVENEVQAELLRGLGCHEGQGYLYGRPLDTDGFVHWLAAREAPQGNG